MIMIIIVMEHECKKEILRGVGGRLRRKGEDNRGLVGSK
jgi:hypothetical protein